MDLVYHSHSGNQPISYNDFLTPSQTSIEPSVKINNVGYPFYTLIMYDPDSIGGTYIHWILANIDVENNQNKNTFLVYQGPNPPDSKIHRYVFELYGTNKKTPLAKLGSRNISLGEAKKILNIETNPVLFTQFVSERERMDERMGNGKRMGGRTSEKIKSKRRKNKIRRKRITRKRI